MTLITSDCGATRSMRSNGPNHLGLCTLQVVAIVNLSWPGQDPIDKCADPSEVRPHLELKLHIPLGVLCELVR